LSSGEERVCSALCVATGTTWQHRIPDVPGRFEGETYHSFHYRSPKEFEGKRVLIVGGGNSAADIACDQQDAQRLYVAQAGVDVVVQSTDQGASFTPFAAGLANAGSPAGLALSKAGTPLLYLAGTHGSYVTAREGSIEDVIFADGFD
jgi:cation diffusion facilitator CzcD-associated flavoprotein CzcO